ncbi:conserved hypothetical protein [Trichinella spiralis]|uniref:hypothetical protein n=1 Tax=Trichinella spiralis TaxID=6334 RepID=UPI0001EFEDD3|nr:conserved hypothetical protein [Trichinella spiralis]
MGSTRKSFEESEQGYENHCQKSILPIQSQIYLRSGHLTGGMEVILNPQYTKVVGKTATSPPISMEVHNRTHSPAFWNKFVEKDVSNYDKINIPNAWKRTSQRNCPTPDEEKYFFICHMDHQNAWNNGHG